MTQVRITIDEQHEDDLWWYEARRAAVLCPAPELIAGRREVVVDIETARAVRRWAESLGDWRGEPNTVHPMHPLHFDELQPKWHGLCLLEAVDCAMEAFDRGGLSREDGGPVFKDPSGGFWDLPELRAELAARLPHVDSESVLFYPEWCVTDRGLEHATRPEVSYLLVAIDGRELDADDGT